MSSYEGLVERTQMFAHHVISAADMSLFTTILVVDSKRRQLAGTKAYSGRAPEDAQKARPPFIGPAKLAELLLYGDFEKVLEMSPLDGLLSTKFMGGVRRRIADDGVVHFLTSASAWSERADAMMALLLNYAMSYEVRLHHVGFGHSSEKAALVAVRKDEEKYGKRAVYLPVDEHHRHYVRVDAPQMPNRVYWREHQWGEGVRPGNVHWDFATMDPTSLLTFVATNLSTPFETWEAGLNDPHGVMWEDNRGQPVGIMARDRWWDVPAA